METFGEEKLLNAMFLPGELVFWQNQEAKSGKFEGNRGPFEIVRANGVNHYEVKDLGTEEIVPVNGKHLRLCFSQNGAV